MRIRGLIPILMMAGLNANLLAVEAIYLDSVPITYAGDYLAPADFYFHVPPPVINFSQVPSTAIANSQGVTFQSTSVSPDPVHVGSGTPAATVSVADADEEAEQKLRVRIMAGSDNGSDTPLSVIRDHLKDSDTLEVVSAGEIYDILVQVETLRLDSSAVVMIVVNAYKEVGNESLIFYNDYGYLGDLRLVEGSAQFAEKLAVALEEELEK